MKEKRFLVIVEGVLLKGGKVLVVKRSESKKFLPGFWEIPGGKVDFGEAPEQAVVREMREETGLNVAVVRAFNTWAYQTSHDGVDWHCVVIDFLLSCDDASKIVLSSEHTDFAWVAAGEKKRWSDNTEKEISKAFLQQATI